MDRLPTNNERQGWTKFHGLETFGALVDPFQMLKDDMETTLKLVAFLAGGAFGITHRWDWERPGKEMGEKANTLE